LGLVSLYRRCDLGGGFAGHFRAVFQEALFPLRGEQRSALCEESSDLLIEIRNLLKEGPSQGKTGSPKRTDLFADNPPTGQA